MALVTAIYENGVLRPLEPLDLAEGERIQLEVLSQLLRFSPVLRPIEYCIQVDCWQR